MLYENLGKEHLEKRKKEYEGVVKKLQDLTKNIEGLSSDPKVMEYIKLHEKVVSLKSDKEILKREIFVQNMFNCDHYFVRIGTDSFNDGHRTDTWDIVKCINCGLTNQYDDYYHGRIWPFSAIKSVMAKTVVNTFYGDYSDDDIETLKQSYDLAKKDYPNATNEEIGKIISFRMKMAKREGK